MKTFAICAVALLAVTIAIVFSTSEPRYHGRTLTSWLQQCYDTPLDETQRLQEAQDAVRAIGAKRALPKLLNLVESKDDPASIWIIEKTEKYRMRFFHWHSAEDFQQLGIAGFEVLGTNAAPAVGELAKLLDEKDHTFTAQRCLVFIGKPAETVFCRALTNQDSGIRQWGIDELASATDDVEVYIARIKDRLKDSSDAVRVNAVDAIGIQTSAPELAVPLLVAALKDSSDSVSSHAASSLADFGTNALETFLTLSNLVENGGSNTASAALKTLVVIAPNEALPILTNCIARKKPATDGALKALGDVAPDKALPIILNGFQSVDLNERRVSFRLLHQYPMTPQIESAMQTAAADSDSVIADRAKEILTDKYQQEHPLESQFSDDPSYEGKRLGEWLKMHDPDGFLSQDATNAIQHLGTNAIPALLQRLTYVQQPFGLRAWNVNMDGVRGLIALGEQAVPALPKLQTLMDSTDQNTVLYAMVSALGTGSNAIPVLVKGLTNQLADVRSEAAHSLTEGIADRFPERRKEIISLLVKLLNDPDPDVRQSVRGDLNEIESAMSAKGGIK